MRIGRRVSPFLCALAAATTFFHLAQGSFAPTFSQTSVVTFTAKDHGFDGPDTVPAGQTTLRLRNVGREPHQLQLLKLEEGKSAAALAAALREPGRALPSWAKHMGGPNGIQAGDEAEATVYLEPGLYVVVCMVPGVDRQTHAALGMQKVLRVTERRVPSPPEFHGNFHMALFEYEFVVVQPLSRGQHTFYVVNRGAQPHQVSLVRLDPGASAADVLAAFSHDEPAPLPGQLMGGMSGLEPGAEGTFTAGLSPGRYAMICLFPNPAAHDSHAAKGMVMNFMIE